MKTHVFLMYGQGGKAVDTLMSGDGLGRIQTMLDAIPGVVAHDPVILYRPDAPAEKRLTAYDYYFGPRDIAAEAAKVPAGENIVLGGTSLGACEVPYVAKLLKRKVQLIFGIQPSIYGRHNQVPSNVQHALCIYNPIPFITFGYGNYYWTLESGNTSTHLEYQYSYWPHPGDNNAGVRNRIYAEVQKVQNG